MDVTPLIDSDVYVIHSVSDAGIVIDGQHYDRTIGLVPSRITPLPIVSISDITPEALQEFYPALEDLDIVILGTGKNHTFVPLEVQSLFTEKGVSIEFMTTFAACRTYNTLLAEGRRLGAVLIL